MVDDLVPPVVGVRLEVAGLPELDEAWTMRREVADRGLVAFTFEGYQAMGAVEQGPFG
jgi:hypothetical protein